MRLAILIAAVLMLLAGSLWLARPQPQACPEGTRADPDRQARLTERLRGALPRLATPDAHALAQAAALAPWCLGQRSELQEDGVLLLDQSLGDDEAAARAGHLLLHLLVPPWPESQAPCEERVAAALNAEAHALSLELELRQVLGVTAPKVTCAFAAEHLQAAPDQRIPLVEKFLRQHPEGALGIPGLASAYAQRCRAPGAATTTNSRVGVDGASDAAGLATEVAWRLDCDETSPGCLLSTEVPLMIRGDAGVPKLAPECKAMRRELLMKQIGENAGGCVTDEECVPTELCIVVPKSQDFWIKDSRRRWEAKGCPSFPECQSANRLCYLGKCVQPWDQVSRERAADVPPGLQKAKEIDRQCLRKAMRSHLEKCKTDLQPWFGSSQNVSFDIVLQPGKVSMYANPRRNDSKQNRDFEQRMGACMKAQMENAGEVFHCFAGGWVRIPWNVNFDRFE